MMKKPQYLKDFDEYKFKIGVSQKELNWVLDYIESLKIKCFNKFPQIDDYIGCMEQLEDKVQSQSKIFWIGTQFIHRSTQECFKENALDREYDQCLQECKEKLMVYFTEYKHSIENLM